MNKLFYLLILCLLLAVLKKALLVLAVTILGIFLWSLITQPQATFVYTGTICLASASKVHPAFWVIGLTLIAGAIFYPQKSIPKTRALSAPD